MAARLTQPADAVQIRQLFDDYFVDVGLTTEGYRRPTLTRLRNRIAQQNIVAAIDPKAGTYCELKLEDDQHIEVASWFPRGPGRSRLGSVLAIALRGMKSRHPQTGSYTVSGVFAYGKDAQDRPDQGQGISEAWQQFFVDDQGQSVVKLRERDGLVEPYAILDDLLLVFERLGV